MYKIFIQIPQTICNLKKSRPYQTNYTETTIII